MISDAVMKLDDNKACGLDHIINQLYRNNNNYIIIIAIIVIVISIIIIIITVIHVIKFDMNWIAFDTSCPSLVSVTSEGNTHAHRSTTTPRPHSPLLLAGKHPGASQLIYAFSMIVWINIRAFLCPILTRSDSLTVKLHLIPVSIGFWLIPHCLNERAPPLQLSQFVNSTSAFKADGYMIRLPLALV